MEFIALASHRAPGYIKNPWERYSTILSFSP
jgi:hypothetical protein